MRSLTKTFVFIFILFSLHISCQTPSKPPPLKSQTHTGSDSDFIGVNVSESRQLAKKRDLIFRIAEIDGQPQPLTKDLRPNRVNFSLKNGIVIKTYRG